MYFNIILFVLLFFSVYVSGIIHPLKDSAYHNRNNYVKRLDVICVPENNQTQTQCDVYVKFKHRIEKNELICDYLSFVANITINTKEVRYIWIYDQSAYGWNINLCLKSNMTYADVINGEILKYKSTCDYVSKLSVYDGVSKEKVTMDDFSQRLIKFVAMGAMLHLLALPFLILLAYAVYKLMLKEHVRSLVGWLDDYMNSRQENSHSLYAFRKCDCPLYNQKCDHDEENPPTCRCGQSFLTESCSCSTKSTSSGNSSSENDSTESVKSRDEDFV